MAYEQIAKVTDITNHNESSTAHDDIRTSLNSKETTNNKSDSYTASSSTTYASTKALVDGLGSISVKPNLIMNPFFTVNQRGVSTAWGATAYGADRWLGNSSYSRALSSNGVTMSAGDEICQKFESGVLVNGEMYTASVMLSDGTIYTGSAVYNSERTVVFFTNTDVQVTTRQYSSVDCLRVQAISQITVKAVKLELGSVSTLANDSVPDYATELLKCKRFYQQYTMLKLSALWGKMNSSNQLQGYASTNIPEMRSAPSLSWDNGTLVTLDGGEITSVYEVTTSTMTKDYVSLYARCGISRSVGFSYLLEGAKLSADL